MSGFRRRSYHGKRTPRNTKEISKCYSSAVTQTKPTSLLLSNTLANFMKHFVNPICRSKSFYPSLSSISLVSSNLLRTCKANCHSEPFAAALAALFSATSEQSSSLQNCGHDSWSKYQAACQALARSQALMLEAKVKASPAVKQSDDQTIKSQDLQ